MKRMMNILIFLMGFLGMVFISSPTQARVTLSLGAPIYPAPVVVDPYYYDPYYVRPYYYPRLSYPAYGTVVMGKHHYRYHRVYERPGAYYYPW
jgi:hypothetical protein